MQQSEPSQPTRTKHRAIDLTGKVFGTLRVTSRAGTYENNKSKEATWNCECTQCGRTSVVRGYFLRSGKNSGKNCPGCKPDRSNEPALNIDQPFVDHWTRLIYAAIGSIIRFQSVTFANVKEDIFQDVLLELAKHRGVIHAEAMSSFIWRVARSRSIKYLQTAANKYNPTLVASGDPEALDSYEFILDSLTDNTQEPEFSDLFSVTSEAFSELSEDERAFANAYVQNTRFKTAADRQRMCGIRKRLKRRVEELKAFDSTQEVYAE